MSETADTGRSLPSAIGIKALRVDEVTTLVSELGQPGFRAGQLVRWLYSRGAGSFEEMSDLPASMRSALAERYALPYPEVVELQTSSDGTRKYLLRLGDGATVETVGLPSGDRLTVCFSTQVGCAMGCSFCATGKSGLVRDLGPGEMVDQLRVVSEDFGSRVSNAVAMGQGEPFANYVATLGALRIMNSKDGLGIGARHLTVSTCGLIQGIRRFSAEPEQFTLAVSLHSAVQATRDELMPGVRGLSLGALRTALAEYASATGRRPSLEYALIEGVTDTPNELAALVEYCRGLHVHVNLIPINPVAGTGFSRATSARAEEFIAELGRAGTEASVRTERGADIDAACGQLKQRSGS